MHQVTGSLMICPEVVVASFGLALWGHYDDIILWHYKSLGLHCYKMAAVVPIIASLYKEGSGHISYSLIWKENLFQKCLWHDPHVVWKLVTWPALLQENSCFLEKVSMAEAEDQRGKGIYITNPRIHGVCIPSTPPVHFQWLLKWSKTLC